MTNDELDLVVYYTAREESEPKLLQAVVKVLVELIKQQKAELENIQGRLSDIDENIRFLR